MTRLSISCQRALSQTGAPVKPGDMLYYRHGVERIVRDKKEIRRIIRKELPARDLQSIVQFPASRPALVRR